MDEPRQIGKYRIIDTLGAGGFATVFRAHDPFLDREIALKVLHPTLLVDQQFVDRFFQEARTVANLRHPGIVTIHEVGEADGRAFLATELAESSLLTYIQNRGALPWDEALALLRPICEALDYAHSRNVIHCDLKPANILLAEDGRPLLSDFGFARLANQHSMSVSMGSKLFGTPGYIAPEVWDQDRAEAPADRYALACITYELFTGQVLFRGTTPIQVMHAHDLGPQFPASWPPGVPQALTALLAEALHPNPERRFASSMAFYRALAALAPGADADGPAPHPTPSVARNPAQSLRRWAAIGGAALVLTLGFASWLARPQLPPGAPTPSLPAQQESPSTAAAIPTQTVAPGTPAPLTPVAPVSGQASEGLLRIAIPGTPGTLDPQQARVIDEIAFIMMAYQPLMSFDRAMQPIPAGAERVDVSADGLRYSFSIAADSKYSDGSPLTAHDYAYAWQRLADPETAGAYQGLPCDLIKGYRDYSAAACQGLSITETQALDREQLRAQLGITAVDDQTLVIELETPASYFLSLAALWIGAPVRAQDVANGPDWWAKPEQFIGNGPFILTAWDNSELAVWKPNPYYRGPHKPTQLKQLELHFIEDTTAAFAAYQRGQLEMFTVDKTVLDAIRADPELNSELMETPGQCTDYFFLNSAYPPFDQLAVRQAVARALDRDAWLREIHGGVGTPAYNLIPPKLPGHRPYLAPFPFDPEAARARLTDSDLPDSTQPTTITLTYVESELNTTQFEWISAQLREHLGLAIALEKVDQQRYDGLLAARKIALIDHGWCADYPDPHTWLAPWQTNSVLSKDYGYTNAEFDEVMKQANAEQNAGTRATLYAQAHELLLNDAAVIPMRVTGNLVLVKPYVQGISFFTITPLDYWWGFFNLAQVAVTP